MEYTIYGSTYFCVNYFLVFENKRPHEINERVTSKAGRNNDWLDRKRNAVDLCITAYENDENKDVSLKLARLTTLFS